MIPSPKKIRCVPFTMMALFLVKDTSGLVFTVNPEYTAHSVFNRKGELSSLMTAHTASSSLHMTIKAVSCL